MLYQCTNIHRVHTVRFEISQMLTARENFPQFKSEILHEVLKSISCVVFFFTKFALINYTPLCLMFDFSIRVTVTMFGAKALFVILFSCFYLCFFSIFRFKLSKTNVQCLVTLMNAGMPIWKYVTSAFTKVNVKKSKRKKTKNSIAKKQTKNTFHS